MLRGTRSRNVEMCSASEAGSYSSCIDFVYHSTLGLRVLQKNRRDPVRDLRNLNRTSGSVGGAIAVSPGSWALGEGMWAQTTGGFPPLDP